MHPKLLILWMSPLLISALVFRKTFKNWNRQATQRSNPLNGVPRDTDPEIELPDYPIDNYELPPGHWPIVPWFMVGTVVWASYMISISVTYVLPVALIIAAATAAVTILRYRFPGLVSEWVYRAETWSLHHRDPEDFDRAIRQKLKTKKTNTGSGESF